MNKSVEFDYHSNFWKISKKMIELANLDVKREN